MFASTTISISSSRKPSSCMSRSANDAKLGHRLVECIKQIDRVGLRGALEQGEVERALVGLQDVEREGAERAEHAGKRKRRDPRDVGAFRVAAGVHRARPAHREQDELARVLPGCKRADAIHLLPHDAVDQPLDRPGGFNDGDIQRRWRSALQRLTTPGQPAASSCRRESGSGRYSPAPDRRR